MLTRDEFCWLRDAVSDVVMTSGRLGLGGLTGAGRGPGAGAAGASRLEERFVDCFAFGEKMEKTHQGKRTLKLHANPPSSNG